MRIVVTRPAGQEQDLVGRLERLGHEVVHCPLIAIEPLGDAPIDVSAYDWVVVTSANGARELRRRAVGPLPRVAAIGPATADVLGGADLVPSVATQEGLLAELPRPAGRVLFAAAEGARTLLPDELGADVVLLYRTRELQPKEFPAADLVILTSASSARALAALDDGSPGRLDRARDVAGRAEGRAAHRRGSPAALERGSRRGGGRSFRERHRREPADLVDSAEPVFITFLTDFGLQDDFVGTCHGVIKRIAPEAQIIDITHGIPAQAVLQGALVLANTLPYMPVGVHLAVVDPGVGSHRRPLALRDGEGRLYVGPDNGLLVPAAERAGITDAHELANPSYALENVSRTFHGRDLFAPAAAHLSRGVAIGELGPPIDPEALVRLELPEPSYGDGVVHATMLYVDSFGNIALNLTRDDLERVGVAPGTRLELELSGERYYAVAARTFADARAGEVILFEDSYRNMSVAISNGNAAAMLHAVVGRPLSIRVA